MATDQKSIGREAIHHLFQPCHENNNTEDGEGQLQGQSKGRIYKEEIRRKVELSPLQTKIKTENEKTTSENADEFENADKTPDERREADGLPTRQSVSRQ